MSTSFFATPRLQLSLFAMGALLLATEAQAVPSFTRQTGQDCAACHIGAFGPQLTPMGMRFKLGGYTDSDGKAGKIPLSAMVVASYKKRDPAETVNHTEHTTLDEASIFLAGRITDNIGSFTQVTHDGVSRKNALDHLDVRWAKALDVSGQEALVGVSVNNAPSAQDPFNTIGAWAYPYTGAEVGAEFAGMGMEGRVLGVNAYALINENYYGELGLYNSLSKSLQTRLGQGHEDAVNAGTLGNAPYWRLGYMQDLKTRAWSVGLLGFNGTIKDGINGDGLGQETKFNQFGVDGSYQFLGNREHIVTVNTSYIREKQTMTTADGIQKLTPKEFKLATSYYYRNTFGGTIAYFNVRARDADKETMALQRGQVFQLDYTPFGKESASNPWVNLRVGVQYTNYNKLISDGARDDRPHDRNQIRLFLWTAI